MKVRPAAAIIENGKLLTMRYRFGTADVYALPGGNPDPGEGMSETIVRELYEEMGVVIRTGEMIMSGEVLSWGNREDVLHCVFDAEITEGVPMLNPDHTTAREIVWLPLNELDSMPLYPNVGAVLANCGTLEVSCGFIGKIDQPLF